MDPSLGPLLYCLCIIAGCALYFHYNCEDRRSKVDIQSNAYASSESKDDTEEGEETATEERPTKKQRITEWAYDILRLTKKAE